MKWRFNYYNSYAWVWASRNLTHMNRLSVARFNFAAEKLASEQKEFRSGRNCLPFSISIAQLPIHTYRGKKTRSHYTSITCWWECKWYPIALILTVFFSVAHIFVRIRSSSCYFLSFFLTERRFFIQRSQENFKDVVISFFSQII